MKNFNFIGSGHTHIFELKTQIKDYKLIGRQSDMNIYQPSQKIIFCYDLKEICSMNDINFELNKKNSYYIFYPR